MAKATYRAAGESIPYTPSVAVTAGDVIVLRSRIIGYAKLDIAANELGALALTGLYDVQKVGGRAFYQGDPVFWDADGNPYQGTAGTGAATDTDGLGLFMGWCAVAAGAHDLAVRVRATMPSYEEDEFTESGSSQSVS